MSSRRLPSSSGISWASRIAEARAHLKAHGRRIAGAVPFGYEADPHTKQLVVCDEQSRAVVRIFQWAASGVVPSVIAAYANALGWITGAGNLWTACQVLSIVKNYVYAGLVRHGGEFREGCHAPLIDREVYHEVQNLIADRRTGVLGRTASSTSIRWILRGILHCGGCGRLTSTHTARSGRCYYRCRSTAEGREACKGVMISAYEIETAVLSEIGAGPGLSTKGQEGVVRGAVRSVIYDSSSRKVKIDWIKPPDGSARDERPVLSGGNIRRRDLK